MKSVRIAAMLLVLISVQVCYCGSFRPTPPDISTGQPVGSISREKTTVKAGPSAGMSEVSDTRDLYDDDGVSVTGGGRARLDFGSNIVIFLFNESVAGGVSGKVAPDVPRRIAWKLERGGVSGRMVEPGGQVTIDVATGVSVTVYGTQFFVLVEPDTGYTVVGNFDGTLEWSHGGRTHSLAPTRFVDVDPQGLSREYDLPFRPEVLFEVSNGSGNDLAAGLAELRREYQVERGPATVTRYLVLRDGDAYFPDLAEAWEVDPDGGVWTYHLRPEIRLADGEPFTAEVVFAVLRGREALRRVKMGVVDELTITIYLPAADFDLQAELSQIPFEVLQ